MRIMVMIIASILSTYSVPGTVRNALYIYYLVKSSEQLYEEGAIILLKERKLRHMK